MWPHQWQWMPKQKMSLLIWSNAFNTTEASVMVRRMVGHCGSFQGMLLCQQVSVKSLECVCDVHNICEKLQAPSVLLAEATTKPLSCIVMMIDFEGRRLKYGMCKGSTMQEVLGLPVQAHGHSISHIWHHPRVSSQGHGQEQWP